VDNRPGDWNLVVPATLILLSFGVLALAIYQAERGGPLGAWMVDVASSSRWDRAASMATVIGLLVAIGALIYARNSLSVARSQLKTQLDEIQREQQRIADEVGRRPKIVFGFKSDRDPCTRMTLVWETETTVSVELEESGDYYRPFDILFVGANLGDKIATHMLWNIEFPIGVEFPGRNFAPGTYIPAEDRQIIIPNCAWLNPQDVNRLTYTVRVPTSMPRLRIGCGVSSAETIDSMTELFVNLEPPC
jgi:hypothetical protein